MFSEYNKVYILGIGGAAMSALARFFSWEGKKVMGYDAAKTSTTEKLILEGIFVHYQCDISNIPDEFLKNSSDTLVVYSPAIGNGDQFVNPLFCFFYENNFTLLKRSDIFARLTKDHFTIAAAGTHGKTSTTGLLAHILQNSDKKVVAFIGGTLREYGTNFLANCTPEDDYAIVIEADEYDRFFLNLDYDIAIVTTIDPDHLDYYGTVADFNSAFYNFISHVKDGTSIAYVQRDIYELLAIERDNIFSYAIDNASICANNIYVTDGYFFFDYVDENCIIKNIRLFTPGKHQIENTIAVIAVCLKFGLSIDLVKRNIASYLGIDRRFNFVAEKKGIVLIDDFAHHPVEIQKLLDTIKMIYPNKKNTVIFQPHTYTRTRDFLDGFVDVLDSVDAVILLDIFPARELDIYNISSQNIFDRLTIEKKILCHDVANIVDDIDSLYHSEVILIVGAGNISSLVLNPIKKWIVSRN